MRRDIFQGIADPVRREIILMIANKNSLNVNSVAERFDISRPAVSKHLKILGECGLIKFTQSGRERFCELDLVKMKEVSDWIDPFMILLNERFNNLDNVLSDINKKSKNINSKTKK